jgi:RHS repeat-associated protein
MKQILIILLFIISGFSGYSQIFASDGGSYTGANPVLEGSTENYTFNYQPDYPMPFPQGLRITFSAFNGDVIGGTTQPFSGQLVSFTVKWGCLLTEGSIHVMITEGGSFTPGNPPRIYNVFEHPITILSYSNYAEFCNQIYPEEQYPSMFTPPLILNVTNCANTCESIYGFTYQWESANISINDPYGVSATWQILPNENNPTYQPLLPPFFTMKAYRRITSFVDPSSGNPSGPIIHKYSKPGFVRHIAQLDPGTISTTTPVIHAYHIIPVINSVYATGGFCDPANYIYTWEATNANGEWNEIGNGETFPPNTEEISYTRKYRRRVNCGGEIRYTNEITINFNYISPNAENRNYTREVDVLVPGVANWNEVEGSLEIGQKLQTTTYLDGFGRPIQKVSRETATPPTGTQQWLDNVQLFQYDLYGRQPKQYLPYATVNDIGRFKESPNPVDDQVNYYSQNSYGEEQYAFSVSQFENSPLNRIINTKKPGKAWHNGPGNSVDYDYPFNKETEKIPITNIGFNETDIPYRESDYKDNTLTRNKTTDENGNRVITYTNKSGLMLFKKVELKPGADEYVINDDWTCIYYVYDDFSRLRYTIEPEAVKYFIGANWDFGTGEAKAVLDGLCFKYFYDERGNTIIKKTPGDEELKMAYDKRNRLTLSQNGNMRNAAPFPKAKLSLYDDNDRSIISALYLFNQGRPFKDYEDLVNNANANDVTANIFQTDLGNASVTTILKYQYYDNYSFPSAVQFNSGFGNAQAYPFSASGVQLIEPSARTKSFATGSRTLVLDGTNTTYLNSTVYYDEKGRAIQTLADNISAKTDIITNQYQWDGRLLSTETIHSTGFGTYNDFSIITKNNYDIIGRLQSIEKKIGTNAFKKISSNEYDDLGRIKVKHLSPDYIGTNGEPDIETLNYSYSLQGMLEGINKDYALKTPGLYYKPGNQYGKFFGLYLGYDKKDYDGNLFDNSLLTGQVAAQVWNTLGDDEQRKYEYTYDAAGRFTSAGFWQRHEDGQAWDNTKLDYSVGGFGAGYTDIEYDLNGNIITMWQKGILTGSNTPIYVDKLYYLYHSLPNSTVGITGNRLKGIIDVGNIDPFDNGKLGDFSDDQNVDFKDYEYDSNGNLIYDENKQLKNVSGGQPCQWGASGIRYNHFDKPEEIHINGKGTIKIIYDADSNKLCRAFESDATGQTTATTYIGAFVYSSTYANGTVSFTAGSISTILGNLSFINFEEGRIRVINNKHEFSPSTATTAADALDFTYVNGSILLPGTPPNVTAGVFDYFIKDQLQNVRMIVTEEEHKGKNTCTMDRPEEIGVFDYPTGAVINKRCIPPGNCGLFSPWTTGSSRKVVKLSKTGYKLGPNTLQKIMAGDRISARCQYFFNETPANINEPTSVPQQVLNSLLQSILVGSAVPASVKDQIGQGRDLAFNIPGAISTVAAPNETESGTTAPKAYLTMLFFDERFNFVSEGSQQLRAITPGGNERAIPDIPAPKNGYVYIYVSNESDIPVYFDNLEVVVDRGELIEENHYYPFGLKIATLSSVKAADPGGAEGNIKNNRQYQGKYSEFDEELAWNDFEARSYDPQIGRWLEVDPLANKSPGVSPYAYCLNNPVKLTDPDGKLPIETIWDVGNVIYDIGKAAYGFLTGNDATLSSGLDDLKFDAIAALIPYLPAGASKLRYADDIARMTSNGRRFADNAANAGASWGLKLGEAASLPKLYKTSDDLLKGIGGNGIQSTALVRKYPAVAEVAGSAERTFLMPGQTIDRYGALGGKWFSSPGTSYGARSIPPGLSPYTKFEVLKPFEVQKSLASPGMFGDQTGFGIQFQSPVGADILIKRGIISPF